jgi:hypothetical protein
MERKLAEEVSRSFVHVPALCEALMRFEADRARWPTLAEFYPQLLDVFDAAAAELEARSQSKP